jgi:PHP family Zn ribbon phosphoesterase
VALPPEETKKNNNRCPKCRRPLTIGVMNRVCQLADRAEGFVPENAIPFKSLVPLSEIIAEAKGVKTASVASEKEYFNIVAKFGTEFNVLLKASREELMKGLPHRLAEGVLRMREGKVSAVAGYDGEYGRISVFGKEDDSKPQSEQQLSLF